MRDPFRRTGRSCEAQYPCWDSFVGVCSVGVLSGCRSTGTRAFYRILDFLVGLKLWRIDDSVKSWLGTGVLISVTGQETVLPLVPCKSRVKEGDRKTKTRTMDHVLETEYNHGGDLSQTTSRTLYYNSETHLEGPIWCSLRWPFGHRRTANRIHKTTPGSRPQRYPHRRDWTHNRGSPSNFVRSQEEYKSPPPATQDRSVMDGTFGVVDRSRFTEVHQGSLVQRMVLDSISTD